VIHGAGTIARDLVYAAGGGECVQLDQAILFVDDVEGMRDFYVERFDLRVIHQERARLVAAGVVMRDIHRYSDVAFCDGVDPEGNVFQLTTR
jgi:hypothetical protein